MLPRRLAPVPIPVVLAPRYRRCRCCRCCCCCCGGNFFSLSFFLFAALSSCSSFRSWGNCGALWAGRDTLFAAGRMIRLLRRSSQGGPRSRASAVFSLYSVRICSTILFVFVVVARNSERAIKTAFTRPYGPPGKQFPYGVIRVVPPHLLFRYRLHGHTRHSGVGLPRDI